MKSRAECNIFNGSLCGLQHKFDGRDAHVYQILMRGETDLTGKNTGEMIRTKICLLCKFLKGQMLMKMFVDKGDTSRNGIFAYNTAPVLRNRSEQCV